MVLIEEKLLVNLMPLHSYNKFIMLSLLDDASEDLREKKKIHLNPSSYKILYPQK